MPGRSDTIGIGLIGAGAIMRLSHAPTVIASPVARIVGVYDKSTERAEALSSFAGADFATDDLDRLLSCQEIDAVIVATPNFHHAEAVIAASSSGKHVLCEKPLAMDVDSARAMIDACEKAGVVLQVGFNQRYWEQVRIAKGLIDSGFIGDVFGFRSVYSERWDAYPSATNFRYDLAQSGGATIIDLAVHRIDLARYLVGDISAVVADLTHCAMPKPADDNVWMLLRFLNGARGSITSDRFSPAIQDGTDIYGTKGTIHIATETINPFHAVPLAIYTDRPFEDLPQSLREHHYPEAWWKSFKGGWLTVKPPRRNPYETQFEGFCESIREGSVPFISGMDGLKAQEVVQAAYLSLRDCKWIDLPLVETSDRFMPSYKSAM